MGRRVPGIAQVRASYLAKAREEWRGEWACALLYRPPSILLTPLFAAAGFSPNAVTLLALACAAALPWCAAAAGADAALLVGGLAIAFCVLDCVDGNLARATGRVSPRGAALDFAVDLAYRVFLYAAIGILAGMIAAGLACALLALAARALRLRAGPEVSPAQDAPLSWPGRVFAFLSGLDHLTPLLVLLAPGPQGHGWLLGWLALYSLGDFLLSLRRFRAARPA